MKRIHLGLAGLALLTAGCHRQAGSGVSPDEWPFYGRDQQEQRFSPIEQINRATVGQLGLAWSRGGRQRPRPGSDPADGRRRASMSRTAWSLVYAFDAATGKLLWSYDPQTPRGRR